MHRKLASIVLATVTAAPVAGMWAGTSVSAATLKAAAKAHVYKGATINTNWGPIQTIITVKNRKITAVKVIDPTHTARSVALD